MIRESWDAIVRATAHHRRAFIVALAAWLVLLLNPFDIDKATREKAKEVASSIAAAFYHTSERVTVILIDQDYLDAGEGRTWPLAYAQQGAILRRIASAHPESIFVDLLYKNAHHAEVAAEARTSGTNDGAAGDNPANLFAWVPRAPDLVEHDAAAEKLKQRQVPIYVAGLPYEHDRSVGVAGWDCATDRTVFLDQSSILEAIRSNPPITLPPPRGGKPIEHIGMVSWSGCKDLYPLLLGNYAYAPTPAYALFREYCQRLQAEGGTKRALCNTSNSRLKPMAVTWGAFIPRAQEAFYLPDVCQQAEPKGHVARAYAAIRQYMVGVVDGERTHRPLNDRLPCPALNVISARVLMALGPDALKQALENKFVFVGANVPGIPDTILSPVHGQVPGVMWHAMALDNLLTMDAGYVTKARSPNWKLFQLVMLLAFALLAVIRLPAWFERWDSTPAYRLFAILFCTLCAGYACALGNGRTTVLCICFGIVAIWRAPKKTGQMVAVTTAICFATVFTMYLLNEQPENWINLAVACIGVSQSVRREITSAARKDEVRENKETTVVATLRTPPRLLVPQLRTRLKHVFSSSRTGAPS